MEYGAKSGKPGEAQADVLAVAVFEEEVRSGEWPQALAELDRALDGVLLEEVAAARFRGKTDEAVVVPTGGRLGAKRVAVVGAGRRDSFAASSLQAVAGCAVKASQKRSAKSVALVVRDTLLGGDVAEALRHAYVGAALASYRFDRYRSVDPDEPRPAPVERFDVISADGGVLDAGAVEGAAAAAKAQAEAIAMARDLVNEGPRDCTPSRLAEVARQIADEAGLECRIYGRDDMARMGMELLLAVAAGSDNEPRLIHLTWRPEGGGDDLPSIALVGKGITFDAGGYNLKPSGHIEDMKIDMAGAAAVLATMRALAELKPRAVVHGIVPSTENLINGHAYKLGDVYRAKNGKTVEILNTDAEGRLILADAMCLACDQKPDQMVTLATLTGACMIALGPYTAGIFSNRDELRERFVQAAAQAGERAWPLPLERVLERMLKSEVADIKNVGERWGGAITAALFLENFTDDRPWVHVDLAGPAHAEKPVDPHVPRGGTGYGVLTLLEHLRREFGTL